EDRTTRGARRAAPAGGADRLRRRRQRGHGLVEQPVRGREGGRGQPVCPDHPLRGDVPAGVGELGDRGAGGLHRRGGGGRGRTGRAPGVRHRHRRPPREQEHPGRRDERRGRRCPGRGVRRVHRRGGAVRGPVPRRAAEARIRAGPTGVRAGGRQRRRRAGGPRGQLPRCPRGRLRRDAASGVVLRRRQGSWPV
ncbi:MAG: hypothetical protein AVDCRST_MAG47-2580, partial [uncultured Nocardioidaceae bacterium]